MYSVELNDDQYISLRYVDRQSFRAENLKIHAKHLQILSPISETERKIYPFYLNIFDKNKRMTFQIYMDKLGIPSRVEVLDVDSGEKQFATTHDLEEMAVVG